MGKSKKSEKKLRNLCKTVKKEFEEKPVHGNPSIKLNDNLIKAIAKSSSLNKSMVKNDKKAMKNWRKEYMNELFSDFQRLVHNYNEKMGFKVNKLVDEINGLKNQKSKLKDEIKALQQEKEALLIK